MKIKGFISVDHKTIRFELHSIQPLTIKLLSSEHTVGILNIEHPTFTIEHHLLL